MDTAGPRSALEAIDAWPAGYVAAGRPARRAHPPTPARPAPRLGGGAGAGHQ